MPVKSVSRRWIRRARHIAWVAEKRLRYGRLRVRTTSHRAYRHALSTAGVVSIDVFDTALFRCVPEPADVFEIAGMRLRDADASPIDPAAFRELRRQAEREARQVAAQSGREEVTLEEIYLVVAQHEPRIDVVRASAEEVAVELAVCVANPDIKKLYDSLHADGRRVAFVSDTYLPHAVVAQLLTECGYCDAHELIVSNARDATKEHGTLLPLVAQQFSIEPSELVHVGDNFGADVRSSRRAGITAYWYVGRASRRSSAAPNIADKVIDRLRDLARYNTARSAEERVLRDVSYGIVAPIFLGLVQWLTEQVRADPSDLVLFCARDGYFLNELYARFARHIALPPGRYFEVSRRALVFPSITTLDTRALDVLCANNAALVLSEFFSRIGIDIREYPDQLTAVGLQADSRVYDQDSRRRVRELFASLSEVVLERARSERGLMLEYLQQSGVFDAHDLVLVDIGWGGTLQQALADALTAEGMHARMRAFYLSTDERILTLDAAAGSARAWFANAAQPAWMQEAIAPGYWLLEVAFAAQHGTVLGYRREADGSVGAVHHAYDAEIPNARASRAIHAASLDVVDRWLRIFGGVGPSLPMRSTFARFQRFVRRPTNAEARFFGDMIHIGGLGTTTEVQAIASPPSLRETVRRPRTMVDAYRESHWELAFLQRVLRSNIAARATLGFRAILRRSRTGVKGRLQQLLASASARS